MLEGIPQGGGVHSVKIRHILASSQVSAREMSQETAAPVSQPYSELQKKTSALNTVSAARYHHRASRRQ